jgi:4-amino-4-deoxy-L-arabinose transferase-like glycosyltransferase
MTSSGFFRLVSILGAAGLLLLSLLLQPLHPAFFEWPVRAVLAVVVGLGLAGLPGLAPWRARMARFLFDSPDRVFLGFLFLTGTTVALLVARLVFDGLPRLDDGVSSLFQARIFADGKLVLEPHLLWPFFELHCVIGGRADTGAWCSMYPPGWPILLVPGVLLDATWAVNPVIHGLLVMMTAVLGAELFNRATGRIAGLLGLASPLLAVLGGEHLSHTATALGLVVCAWAVLRLLGTGRNLYGWLAGCGWGFAFLCRPLTAVVVGGVIGLAVLIEWRKALPAWRGLVAAAFMAGVAFTTLSAYQHLTTGDWQTPGHVKGMGRNGKMGFVRFDEHREHTVADGWEFTLKRLRNINHHLTAWPVPFYLLALYPFLAGRARWREAWLLLPSLGLLAVFSTFWYYERYYPSRYISEAMPMLLVLTASVLVRPGRKDPATPAPVPEAPPPPLHRWAAPLLSTGLVFMLTTSGPYLLRQFHDHYGDVEAVLPKVVEACGITNAVVFMDWAGEGTDAAHPRNTYYATGFMRNDLDLDGDVIYAQNLREVNGLLMQYYPGRDYYIYRFDRTTSKARLFELTLEGTNFTTRAIPARGEFML